MIMGFHAVSWPRVLLPTALAAALLAPSCGDETTVTPNSNPVPHLTALYPDNAVFDGPSFTLTATGSGFVEGSVVIWNGVERPTQYVSATEITATILESDIATPVRGIGASEPSAGSERVLDDRTVQVWVRTGEPGGGTSGALPFHIQELRPTPAITSISPSSSVIGGPELTLDVFGFGFYSTSAVRWEGTDLVTTLVNGGHLKAVIPAANVAAETTAAITVMTPPPGGGTSNAVSFSVIPPNPLPSVTSLAPTSVMAGGAAFDLTVDGSGFVQTASVLWNGSPRPTVYISGSRVRASIAASDIADGKTAMVAVSNPLPGGGVSNELVLRVDNPQPNIISLSPNSAPSGSAALTITITGAGFVHSSTARWNGSDRSTTFTDATRISVALTAADLQAPGFGNISVFNPPPAGGTSGDALFTLYITANISANDLIFDPVSGRIFASVPSTSGLGNTISAIDPATGNVVSSVFVGSEPGPLARSDDGSYLYVGLNGSSKIRRYIIASETADIEFDVGSDPFFGPLAAEDIEVLPGMPGTIAVSTVRPNVSPRHGGVFIYDDGVRRATGTQNHTGSNRIEPSASATTLYGYNNETTEFGFRQLTVSANGVAETALQRDLISGFGVDILYAGGRVYASTGVIVDPVSMSQIGTLSSTGPMTADASINKVFFLSRGNREITVYNTNTFLKVGGVKIDAINASSSRLIRVGNDGIAFIVNGNTVAIARHPLFGE